MRLIDAEAVDLQCELFSYTRYTGIDEAPYEDATKAIDEAPTVDAIPRERIEQMIKEISICKTENEMRIAERDYKNKLLISGIFSEVMAIIHKYTKEQTDGALDSGNNERA